MSGSFIQGVTLNQTYIFTSQSRLCNTITPILQNIYSSIEWTSFDLLQYTKYQRSYTVTWFFFDFKVVHINYFESFSKVRKYDNTLYVYNTIRFYHTKVSQYISIYAIIHTGLKTEGNVKWPPYRKCSEVAKRMLLLVVVKKTEMALVSTQSAGLL